MGVKRARVSREREAAELAAADAELQERQRASKPESSADAVLDEIDEVLQDNDEAAKRRKEVLDWLDEQFATNPEMAQADQFVSGYRQQGGQ